MSTPDAPLRGLAAAIRRADAPDRLHASVRDFMASQGVEGDDLDAMQAVPAERWMVYRRLVFNRFIEIVGVGLPRTCARLGPERLRAMVVDFIDAQASQSPYLRDVAGEFAAWMQNPSVAAGLEPWLIDLARHELLSFEVASLPEERNPLVVDELAIDAPVCFQDAARLARYSHAVHLLPDDELDDSIPERRETAILAYRDDEHRVRFLSLEPVAAAIVEELLAGRALGDAIREGCDHQTVAVDDAILAGIAELLADLADRGILRGMRK